VRNAILKGRFILLIGILFAFSIYIFGRLFYLQVVRFDYYKQEAIDQAQGIIKIDLPRSEIVDRNGVLIAASIEKPSLCAVKPQELKDIDNLARKISKLTGEKPYSIAEKIRSRRVFTWLARKLPEEMTKEAEEIVSSFDGVSLIREWGRNYPRGVFASNLIGTVGVDGGLSGLEENWEGRLNKGQKEYIVFRVGKQSWLYPLESVDSVIPEPEKIALTIDEAVQYQVEKSLEKIYEDYNPLGACAIVISIPEGEILALGVRPTFDPNKPAETPFAKWRNIAVLDSYEPGSTFKVITLSAALDAGIKRPYDEVLVTPLTIGNHTIKDDHPPHKTYYNLEEVLTYSSNCGAGRIGMSIPKQTFYQYIRKFGIGTATALGLKGESEGLIRRPEGIPNKVPPWSDLSAPSISFGQEVRATPLQLALVFATIANGGIKVNPKIELGIKTSKGERVISEETAKTITKMLVNVVDEGTGKSARIPYVRVAGKTGTAQKLGKKLDSGRKGRIAYFVGFAPAENPKVVTLVMVDDPIGQIYGGAVSAPAFAEITAFALKRLNVDSEPYIKNEIALLSEGKR
jgi:cell division protein FtsI/penicillin-binding protein 2